MNKLIFARFDMQTGTMKYKFREIEPKWQEFWAKNKTFRAGPPSDKPKYYVLDMFPYPSGAGLHVGHPLGYIASDIYARYKRHKGFNVLHPMGYDSFGLPAEQYAIQTGQPPARTTEANIARYREQLDKLGFSFDWSREVRTSDPTYYKWTQWIFIRLFESWYDREKDRAEPITRLVSLFETSGNQGVRAACDEDTPAFSAAEWNRFSDKEKQELLLKYRLTYLADTEVNWCPALGTVLANDEIVNGVSERGGHPVERKKMTQWIMRITAYAQRLLDGLEHIDWPQSLKDAQTNWIGRSEGALVTFKVLPPTPSQGGGEQPGYVTGEPGAYRVLLERAKEMRKNPTRAESALWTELRRKNLGHKFRRQHPIGRYIADFVCLRKRLIVEVDGDIHQFQQEEDGERQSILERDHGFTILRFSNDEVLQNKDVVLAKIETYLNSLSSGEGWGEVIPVFTTRPDTLFGVSFMTLAPEHELVSALTTPAQKKEVEAYVKAAARRSERDRLSDVKRVSGAFTGSYAEHPFTGEAIPIWIGDYVLAGYGTGAVMSVPAGDQRDHNFARHFGIPIPNVFEGVDVSKEAFADKDGTVLTNSQFLDGLGYREGVKKVVEELEAIGRGEGRVNYRLRDAVFSRQRYWGEPFPVYYDADGMPQMIGTENLPLKLPEVEKYLPTPTGEPPLGNAAEWAWDTQANEVVSNERIDRKTIFPLELNTMPGWAGSSQYFNRYMDPHNEQAIFSEEAVNYWQDVDLYIGGIEHATGHLLYSRFWQHFMYDLGLVPKKEYARKMINQGMILGMSAYAYQIFFDVHMGDDQHSEEQIIEGISKILNNYPVFVSKEVRNRIVHSDKANFDGIPEIQKRLNVIVEEVTSKFPGLQSPDIKINCVSIHVDVSLVNSSDELDTEAFKKWRPEFENALFIKDGPAFMVSREVEKMSKSKYNVVNPDAICEEYGADSLRLYEMFLGPLEQAKPWNTAGISGVHAFLKKLWKLYHSGEGGQFHLEEGEPGPEALKVLHKTIRKVEEDIEALSFNTTVSTFMICVNELIAMNCHARAILEPLVILVSPYAPHIAEELWQLMGNQPSVARAPFPAFDESYLVEKQKEYPVSFNGKLRFTLPLSLDLTKEQIEEAVMSHERTRQQLDGRQPKKVIVVPGKIVNIVV